MPQVVYTPGLAVEATLGAIQLLLLPLLLLLPVVLWARPVALQQLQQRQLHQRHLQLSPERQLHAAAVAPSPAAAAA
jgi:hypothetical protein